MWLLLIRSCVSLASLTLTGHNNAPVLLTRVQRDEVLVMLKTTTPNDHGYTNSAFWSTRILATLIERKYGVAYSS